MLIKYRRMAHGWRLPAGVSSVALLAIALLAAAPAVASQPASKASCDGVHLVSAPYLATGIGSLTIDVSGPLDDLILCQPINLRPGEGLPKQRCENSQVPGFRLKPRLAADSVRCLVNKVRGARGLHQLDPQDKLRRAAKRHTDHMVSSSCFAHVCPGEADLVGRVTSAGYLPCTCTWSVGENIAWGLGKHGTPAAIVAAWMASPPHREMILTGSMRDIDIGVKSGKPGSSGARAATYTADFGVKS
jgi:uncharacterized protein YkwD